MTADVLLFRPRTVEKCLAIAARWRNNADVAPTESASVKYLTVGMCLLKTDWWARMARHIALGR